MDIYTMLITELFIKNVKKKYVLLQSLKHQIYAWANHHVTPHRENYFDVFWKFLNLHGDQSLQLMEVIN